MREREMVRRALTQCAEESRNENGENWNTRHIRKFRDEHYPSLELEPGTIRIMSSTIRYDADARCFRVTRFTKPGEVRKYATVMAVAQGVGVTTDSEMESLLKLKSEGHL